MHYLVVPLILLKLKKNLTSKDAKLSLEVKILCTLQVNSPSILKMSIEDNQLENTYIKTLQRVYWNLIMGCQLLWVKKHNRVILDSQELFQSHQYLCPPGMKHPGGCRTLRRG